MCPQVLIVQFGGAAFQTSPLTVEQWGACVGTGALTLFVRAALCTAWKTVPDKQAGQLEPLMSSASVTDSGLNM